ncbi:MAG TPA: 4Fe-4S binding protein [Syntrophorhabdaceae bacterium]|nr:4Fe-4S binding protein [Syntrophorhabdaceae bacterium]
MEIFDTQFLDKMKESYEIDLAAAVTLESAGSLELRQRASALLPTAVSVVVFAKEIYEEIVDLLVPINQAGETHGGDLLPMHSDYLNGRLNRAVHGLADYFRQRGYRSLPLPAVAPTDSRFLEGLLSYKHVAQLAGLGEIGWHSMLITEQFGPRVRLACVVTEAVLEPSPHSAQSSSCTGCGKCVESCPAKALEAPSNGVAYSMNKFSCRSYRLAGLTCSVCMRVCDEALRICR